MRLLIYIDDHITPPGVVAEANESNESRYSQDSKNVGFWTFLKKDI